MKRIAIFASGNGSNAKRIIDYFNRNGSNIEVSLVISNKAEAGVTEIARNAGVAFLVVNRSNFYESNDVVNRLQEDKIDLIVLAGFLWLVPDNILSAYSGRIVNIHPALLPKYGGHGMYGHKVHVAVKNAGEVESGITIHWVNERYDEGEIIFQATCPVEPSDSPEDIARKVQQLEHKYFPLVIEKVLNDLDKDKN